MPSVPAVPTRIALTHDLPSTPAEIAALAPDQIVTVSSGVEERCSTAVVKRRMRLGAFVDEILAPRREGAQQFYLKQHNLDEVLSRAGRRWRCGFLDGTFSQRRFWPFAAAAAATALLRLQPRVSAGAAAALVAAAAAVGAVAAGGPVLETRYLWMGGRGASTGLHNDDECNCLLILHGSKRVKLWPPECRRHLAVNRKYDSGTECCDVDAEVGEDEILRRHPCYRGCPAPLVITLEAGEALFIPRFWYHSVSSLSTSVSVNVFLSTPLALLRWGPRRALLGALHALGAWRDDCVCHSGTWTSDECQ